MGDRGGGVYGDALYVRGMAQRAAELSRYASSAGVGSKMQKGGGAGAINGVHLPDSLPILVGFGGGRPGK